MALRKLLGCLPVAALALCALTACKSSDPKVVQLENRCAQLAKACGDEDKHIDKLSNECKQSAPKLVEKGCQDKATALYDCYEKELCGKTDKVWTLDDLRVLADRKNKCEAQRDAIRECAAAKAK
jgi:hypothetical protein